MDLIILIISLIIGISIFALGRMGEKKIAALQGLGGLIVIAVSLIALMGVSYSMQIPTSQFSYHLIYNHSGTLENATNSTVYYTTSTQTYNTKYDNIVYILILLGGLAMTMSAAFVGEEEEED